MTKPGATKSGMTKSGMTKFREQKILALTALAAMPVLAAPAASAAKPPADLIIIDGKIYTGDDKNPWAEAVAVKDGLVIAVGGAKKVMKRAGPNTKTIDLDGRLAIPGIVDAHSHPLSGSIKNLFECNFPFSAGPDEIAATVGACVARAGAGETWVIGGQWDSNFFVDNKIASPRKFLDKVSGGKAVALADDSGHNSWVNSKALALIGVTATTADPEGGRIGREADGKTPNGILEETASQLAEVEAYKRPPEQYQAAIAEMERLLNGYGITGVKIANVPDEHLAAINAVDKDAGLSLHVTTSLATKYGPRKSLLDVPAYVEKRERYRSENVNTNSVKIFLDGVPTASRTAAMLAPYAPDPKFPPEYRGEMHLSDEMLAADVTALDAAGFSVKIHTAGDGSVRRALDAIEAARTANGKGGKMHELAHAGYVDPADLPRFAMLNAAPDFSPYIWSPSPIIDSVLQAVGLPRGEHYWPTKDLVESGALVIAGSDWPSAVATPNPWPGIESLVTRMAPEGDHPGALWPEQAVSLEKAIEIFTEDSAVALGFEKVTGRIETGAYADIIVLSQDIFDIAPEGISDTEVLLTLFKGHPVAGKPPFIAEKDGNE